MNKNIIADSYLLAGFATEFLRSQGIEIPLGQGFAHKLAVAMRGHFGVQASLAPTPSRRSDSYYAGYHSGLTGKDHDDSLAESAIPATRAAVDWLEGFRHGLNIRKNRQ